MTKITKLSATGFKSFAKKTDLNFGDGFNCIIGANGSGKSNVMDALCFVLGKISAKSMRAEKSAHLLYNGGKNKSTALTAEVSIHFDNSNKRFPLDEKEIKITRIVKKTGQSIYKINNKKRTRQQVVDLLASAKIDPNGHNVILQGDITYFTNMKPLERRLVVEEISGISIFEDKKNKAILELGKVEEKLKEANILLTEREAHLRELKKERDQAKKYLDLKNKIKDNKATYINLQIKEKEIKKNELLKSAKEQESKLNVLTDKISNIKKGIEENKEDIQQINLVLDEKGEKEQLNLRKGITNIKTDLIQIKSRIETLQKEIIKIQERKKQLEENISKNNKKIENLFKRKGSLDTEKIKLERQSERSNKKIDFTSKINELARLKSESSETFTNPSINSISSVEGVHGTVSELGEVNEKYALALEICAGARMKSVITKDDFCAEKCIKILKENRLGIVTFLPLNKIRARASNLAINSLKKLNGVHGLAIDLIKYNKKYHNAFSNIFGSTLIVKDIPTARKLGIGRTRMVTLEGDLLETSGAIVGGYRRGLKIGFKQKNTDEMILNLEKEIEDLKEKSSGLREEKIKVIELEHELSGLDKEIDMFSTENERIKNILKNQDKEKQEFETELNSLKYSIKNESGNLKNTEKKEKDFYEKLKNLTKKRNKLTEEINKKENILEVESEKTKKIEHKINEISIYKAKEIAELEALKKEFEEYKDGKIRKSVNKFDLKREISQFERLVSNMGNINMKALEIYEELVQEHQKLVEKSEKIRTEKIDVLDMIGEIEEKKTGIFMETFNSLNNKFKEIFSSLSTKGHASLILENKEFPLEGGVDIAVKITGKKHLDLRSLSGGEKSLVTLALIFAIQEHDPASFYILDEVDAALDKHNAEKLAKLFKQYSSKAQYIIISHNDSIIAEGDRLFGISMQDGISKITSLKL
jgi:chromosome segregation protein